MKRESHSHSDEMYTDSVTAKRQKVDDDIPKNGIEAVGNLDVCDCAMIGSNAVPIIPPSSCSSSLSSDQPKQYPELFTWLFKICALDVTRYIFEYVDFGSIILGLQLTNKEIRDDVFGLLNEKWWIRVSNYRWYGYFSDALLQFIYKTAQDKQQWKNACWFKKRRGSKWRGFRLNPNKDRIIYTIIANLQSDLDKYVELNLNAHLEEENKSLLELDLYYLPSHLVPSHQIPSFLCKYLLLNVWKYADWDKMVVIRDPIKHIPFGFVIDGEHDEDEDECLTIITDPDQVYDVLDWDGDSRPTDAPLHSFVTWFFFAYGPFMNGYYTGPVYVYEAEWNKDWGVVVKDTDYDAEGDSEYETKLLVEDRSKYGSTRIRKFYWPDSDYFPLVNFDIHRCDFSVTIDTALKTADKILELVRANPEKGSKYMIDGFDRTDGIIRFPCHLLGNQDGTAMKIEHTDKLYKYAPKYSRYWMHKVSNNLAEAMGIDY